jgi:hypothetical protein
MPLQHGVDLLHRRAALDHNPWIRLIGEVHLYAVEALDRDQYLLCRDQSRPGVASGGDSQLSASRAGESHDFLQVFR